MATIWPQIITGSFTLVTALSITFLNDYLATSKEHKMTKKQKAIKLYALLNKIVRSLSTNQVIAQNILKDAKFDYFNLLQEGDNPLSVLEEIEVLIVENFYDLHGDFFELMRVVNEYNLYLLGVITGSETEINSEEFSNKNRNHIGEITKLQINLQNNVLNRHIKPFTTQQRNSKKCDFFQRLKIFFRCKNS